jgi:hypothetical protein
MGFVRWADVPATTDTGLGPWLIYALVDPSDEGVRYVGVTNGDLEKRRRGHIAKPTNRMMRRWLVTCPEPSIRVLFCATTHWDHAEQGWIEWFRERGELLNVDPGGMCRGKDGKLKPKFARFARKAKRRRHQKHRTAKPRPDPCGDYLRRRRAPPAQSTGSIEPTIRHRGDAYR